MTACSSDGSSIVFVSGSRRERDATSELRVVDASGRNAPSLVPHAAPYADYAQNWRL
jgi:hypothetical protein